MPAIPFSNQYPEFVPDQLLTPGHLNNLFAYADGEGRATRSRLIGIGIVCGLEVKTGANSITITKGCGITTAGYLVRLEEDTRYTHLKEYDPLTEHKYDRFLNTTQTAGTFKIEELIREATVEGAAPLSAEAIKNKAVLMFVELFAEGAKNCDPASCDDKGTTVTVSYKPMLVDEKVAETLLGGGVGEGNIAAELPRLPQLRMPRYDVPATPLADAAAVLDGFRKVLTPNFLKAVEAALSKTYAVFAPLVSDHYTSDPFGSLSEKFTGAHSDLDTATILALQYHYDFFSDLILAHDELRRAGEELLTVCCPDEALFPRHLVLGATSGGRPRHPFHPSAALAGEGKLVEDLRLLFRRLVLLMERFSVPAPKQSGKKTSAVPIRITPSQWGTEPLSQRAIPFYYRVAQPVPALFESWNARCARTGASGLHLSYHAAQYSKEQIVTEPLRYDLEPYDFLRIEGHVGQKMPTALASILKLKAENRLPFEVVALGADLRNVSRLIRSLLAQQRNVIAAATKNGSTTSSFGTLNRAAAATLQTAAGKNGLLGDCHVQDLEAIYDTLRAELECMLCCEMKYFYDVEPQRNTDNRFTNAAAGAAAAATLVPKVPLLKNCAPEFRYKEGSLGASFEAFWPTLAARPYNSPDQWLEQVEALLAASAGNKNSLNKDVLGLLMALLLLYYMEKLWEILPGSLSLLDAEAFATRYEDLMQVARGLKELIDDDISGEGDGDDITTGLFMTEDVVDHLDALIYACKDAGFEAVYREYLLRYMRALLRQKFGFFANQHPGIQHKAGVPVGGTFILVYHEAEIELEDEEEEARNVLTTAQQRVVAFKTFFQAKKAEATGTAAKKSAASTRGPEAAGPVTSDAASALQDGGVVTVTARPTRTYSSLLSEGDAKAVAFFDRFSTTLIKDPDGDRTLQELLDELADGTVIADFCLPYLCCSDCPPMQFVVRAGGDEEPDPERPSLKIEQKDYCQDDKAAYPIQVSPEGGELSGEGLSVNNKTFHPTNVSLPAGAASKDVPLSYTTDGGTDTKTLTVFAKPIASFRPSRSLASNLAFLFEDTSTHAQSWDWDFGDGGTSTEKSPRHTYQQSSQAVVTLTVHNGPCRDVTTQTITFGQPTEPPAQCAPLAPTIAMLETVVEADTTVMKSFQKAFGAAEALKELVEVLKGVEPLPVTEQVKVINEKGTPDMLVRLLSAVQAVILNGKNGVAIEVYQALVAVAFYIACIQSADLEKMTVSLNGVLEVFKANAFAWADVDRQWPAADKARFKALLSQTNTERGRAAATGKMQQYAEVLDSIIDLLESMNL